jgi:hypothetical protein
MHAPLARTRPPLTRYPNQSGQGSLIAMSHATPWERAAEQLHTAAADVINIAERREQATTQPPPARQEETPMTDSTCPANPTPVTRAAAPGWMAGFPPAHLGSGLDTSVPHPARVYAYWLGGKDHFAADRKAAEEVIQLRPQVIASARANRAFLTRVVRFLAAECDIRQFLDIGVGLPAPDNTHEVAQQVDPGCRVVYADNDPLVLVHARAHLVSTPEGICEYVDADLLEPEAILAQAAKTLDFTRPVALLLLAVLHFLPDAAGPGEIVATLASALAPGSYVAISHLTGDFAPEQVAAATSAYNELAPVQVTARSHIQVTALFGGLSLLAPGVVPVSEWRPEMGDPFGQPADLHAGVARVPRRMARDGGRA